MATEVRMQPGDAGVPAECDLADHRMLHPNLERGEALSIRGSARLTGLPACSQGVELSGRANQPAELIETETLQAGLSNMYLCPAIIPPQISRSVDSQFTFFLVTGRVRKWKYQKLRAVKTERWFLLLCQTAQDRDPGSLVR